MALQQFQGAHGRRQRGAEFVRSDRNELRLHLGEPSLTLQVRLHAQLEAFPLRDLAQEHQQPSLGIGAARASSHSGLPVSINRSYSRTTIWPSVRTWGCRSQMTSRINASIPGRLAAVGWP